MKRIIVTVLALVLAVALALTFVACQEAKQVAEDAADLSALRTGVDSAFRALQAVSSYELDNTAGTITATVETDVDTLDLTALTIPNGSVKVYADEARTEAVTQVTLAEGENVYYLTATQGNLSVNYKLIVTRKASSSGDPDDPTGEPTHTHTFSDAWTYDAENHWHAATCGHAEVQDLAAHTLEHHDAQAATCTADGWDAYDVCSICGYSTKTVIPATGHTLEHHDGKAATCEDVGWDEYDTCKNCDYTTYVEIPANGHTYGDLIDTVATCTDTGMMEHYKCSVCHKFFDKDKTETTEEVLTIEIDPTNHDYIFDSFVWAQDYTAQAKCICSHDDSHVVYYNATVTNEVTTAPTCEGTGVRTYTAKYDGHTKTKTEELPANGHTLEHHEAQGATCTKDGWDDYDVCSICGYSTKTVIPAAHTLEHHDGKAATCEEGGWEAYDTCENCDYTTYAEIPATGHDYAFDSFVWAQDYTAQAKYICSHDASHVVYYDATVTNEVTTAPTCEGTGVRTYTATYDEHAETKTEELPANGHTLEHHDAQAATCTEDGWDDYDVCSICGYSTKTVIPAAHTLEHHDGKAATCEEGGWEAYDTCENCDYTTYAEIPATGHDYAFDSFVWAQDYTAQAKYICSHDALHVVYYDATVTNEVTTAPTCEGTGVRTYTAKYDGHTETKTEELPATGHTAGEWTEKTAATCTEKGSKHKLCTVCGTEVETGDIDPLGHDYDAVVTPPTCTAQGYTTHTCSRCNDRYVDTYVDALGHDYELNAFVWQGLTAQAKFVCSHDASHITTQDNYIVLASGDENAGSIKQITETYSLGDKVTIEAETNAGYTWLGWYDGAEKVSDDLECTITMSAESKIYTAKWTYYTLTVLKTEGGEYDANTPRPFIVQFLSNGGTAVPSQRIAHGETITYPTVPTLSGYAFKGWYTDEVCTTLYDFTAPISGDITLYAGWEAMVSTGYYSRNYIDVARDYNTSNSEYSISTSGTSSTKPAYIYFTALTSGSYTLYYKNASSSSSYATYLYVYNVTQRSVIRSNITVASTAYNSLSFSGNAGDVIYVRNYKSSSASTFYFYVKGGAYPAATGYVIKNNVQDEKISQGESITLTASTNAGYTWLGWYDEADGKVSEGASRDFTFTMTTENRTFTAKWSKETVVKNIDGAGSITELTGRYLVGDEAVVSATTTNLGYTWVGWYDSEGNKVSGGLSYTIKMSAQSEVYTATWEITEEMQPFVFTSTLTTCEITGVQDRTITELTIPDSVTSIAEGALSGCSSLESLTIPFVGATIDGTSNTHFGYIFGATSYSENRTYVPFSLKTVVITSNMSLDSYAFYGCSSLTSITIPDSVTSIGAGALSGCSNLVSLSIPFVGGSQKTSSDTDQYPFGYIFGTTDYTGSSAVKQNYYGSSAGNTTTSTYYIPDTLKNVTVTGGNILRGAFYNYSWLSSIKIPDEATSIREYAFRGCSGLTSITIPDSVTSIGSYAFYGCTGLIAVVLSEDSQLTSIGESAFSGCSLLESLTIPDGVTNIETYAFYMCGGLTEIAIPEGVTSIGAGAFCYCTSLKNITVPNGVKSIGGSTFSGCSGLTSITIPSSVASIGDRAFSGCSSLEELAIPSGVTSIGSSAFSGCSSLEEMAIPTSVTRIGSSAFSGCSGLISIEIPSVGASLMGGALYFGYIFGASSYSYNSSCVPSSLKSVVITGGSSIGNYAFYGCSSLTSITIPASVTSIGSSAFSDCSSLTSITIPDSVTSIGSSAFSGCSSLDNITIPFVGSSKSATSASSSTLFGYIFGTSSYTGGTRVTQYYTSSSYSQYFIPSSLRAVEVTGGNILYGAFYNCSFVEYITVPEDVTSINAYAFYGCSSLKRIVIPDSVASINNYAFYKCTDMAEVVISANATYIGPYSFYDCDSLTSITIPASVTKIANYAFAYCKSLASVTFAENSQLKYILELAFNGCDGLTSIDYKGSISGWCNIDGLHSLMSAGSSNRSLYINGERIEGDLDILSGINNIRSAAFYRCVDLTSVTIPDSVKSIGYDAFCNCYGLYSVTIGANVTSIENDAFGRCYKLVDVYDRSSLKIKKGNDDFGNVGYYAKVIHTTAYSYIKEEDGYVVFESGSTKSLIDYVGTDTELIIPEGITEINQYAFDDCKDLISIAIPNSVTSIGDNAFEYCSSLTAVTIGTGVTGVGTRLFAGCYNLASIIVTEGNSAYHSDGNCLIDTHNKELLFGCKTSTIPASGSVIKIADRAFYGCSGLTSITIPSSVTRIGNNAFCGCSGLISVAFAENSQLVSIGNSAFYYCLSLNSITIPASVTNIKESAFSNCTGLTEVFFAEDSQLTSIGFNAFSGCSSLTSISIPDNVTTMGNNAFMDCNSLNSVIIGQKVASIGRYTFFGCTSLTSVTIGSKVETIGDSAFYYCKRLTSITIPSSVTSIGQEAFSGCSGLTSVTLGSGVTKIGADAFLGCYKLVEIYNRSTLGIQKGYGGNGYIAYYAKAVYTKPYTSKLSTDENGYLLYTDGDSVSLIDYVGTDTDLTLPEGITEINQFAFVSRKELTSITIPASVTSIGDHAFSDCSSLISITIPASVTSIGANAFYYCPSLTSVTFENTSGWYRTSSASATSGTNMTVTDAATNANALTSGYVYYWKRA